MNNTKQVFVNALCGHNADLTIKQMVRIVTNLL